MWGGLSFLPWAIHCPVFFLFFTQKPFDRATLAFIERPGFNHGSVARDVLP
jgi:hypothetical protein